MRWLSWRGVAQAEEYVRLREPYLINDVFMQRSLLDRREMYKICMAHGIPVPNFAVISRCVPCALGPPAPTHSDSSGGGGPFVRRAQQGRGAAALGHRRRGRDPGEAARADTAAPLLAY